MELWLVLGILSYLSYAISTSIDKYFMDNGHNPVSTNTFKMFFDGVILLVIGIFFFDLGFTPGMFMWSLILGGIYAISGIVYFTALKTKDAAVVVPYFQSSQLLLVFIAAIILFDEAASIFNYIGIVLILIGIYAVLSKDGLKFPKLDRIIFLILMIVILNTAYALLAKRLLFDIDPINLAIMMYFSSAIVMVGYVSFSRKQKRLFEIKSSRIIVSAFFGAMGTFLLYSALHAGNASKVYAISGLQSVFVFMIASSFLKERFCWHRMVGTVIVVMGIFLISL